MKIIIPGNPIPWKRTKSFFKNNKMWSYNTQKIQKNHIKSIILQEIDQKALKFELENFLFLSYHFYVLPPLSRCIQNKAHCMWHLEHPTKFDLDNCIKMYNDCFNNLIYNDDRQIISIHATKQYSNNPRTEITIMPFQNLQLDSNTLSVLGIFDPQKLMEFISDAQKISKIPIENMETLEIHSNGQFLNNTASILIDFSLKYASELTKIKKNVTKTEFNCTAKPIC